ncbi:MAG: hypothetical protein ACXV98_05220, partial [Ilumatobacteraceae bacterium]
MTTVLAGVVGPADAPVEALGRVRPAPVGAAAVGATGVEDGVVEVVAHGVVGGAVVAGIVAGTSVVGVEVVTAVSTVALGVVSGTTTVVVGWGVVSAVVAGVCEILQSPTRPSVADALESSVDDRPDVDVPADCRGAGFDADVDVVLVCPAMRCSTVSVDDSSMVPSIRSVVVRSPVLTGVVLR